MSRCHVQILWLAGQCEGRAMRSDSQVDFIISTTLPMSWRIVRPLRRQAANLCRSQPRIGRSARLPTSRPRDARQNHCSLIEKYRVVMSKCYDLAVWRCHDIVPRRKRGLEGLRTYDVMDPGFRRGSAEFISKTPPALHAPDTLPSRAPHRHSTTQQSPASARCRAPAAQSPDRRAERSGGWRRPDGGTKAR